MTKKDFEAIASILSDLEVDIEERYSYHGDKRQRAIEMTALESAISGFVAHFRASSPRFNEAKFRTASRPINFKATQAWIDSCKAQSVKPDAHLPEWMRAML